jgi:alanine racemase
MQVEKRRAWIDIDLGALKRNAATLAKRAGVPIVPMVKADAYGIGAIPVVRALDSLDPWGYGVATIGEGEELRDAGVERPILVVSPLLPWDMQAARALRLTPTLGFPEEIAAWAANDGGDWHLAIDTGMSRQGIPYTDVASIAELVRAHPPEGAFTHLHSSDRNDETMTQQQERFRQAVAALPERPRFLHVEASAAIERQSPSPWDLVRPGVFLYGAGGEEGSAITPEPVAHLRARVLEVRDVPNGESVSYGATYRAVGHRRIATIGAGYADGFRRGLGDHGTAILRGRLVRIAGVVNMDMTMLDVTEVPCEAGDVVTLLGRDGDEHLDLNEISARAGLSAYEVLTGLRMRAPRLYLA